jgi:arsenate reductase
VTGVRRKAGHVEIWVNPSCSKCAVALDELAEAGVPVEQRRYLDEPPTVEELRDVLARLGLQPWDITRTGEPRAVELEMADWPRDRDRWVEALAQHPELIQRPILLLDDGTAMLGRDAEALRLAVRRSR